MLRLIDRVAEVLGVLAFLLSSAFIFINVLNRYLVLGLMRDLAREVEALRPAYFAIRNLFGDLVVTADEVPGLLLVWVAFLGAYCALRHDGHIAFDLIVNRVKPNVRRTIFGINNILMTGFLALTIWQSVRMIQIAGATEIETAEIAQGWFMLILPVSATLMIGAVVHRFLFGNPDRGRTWD